MLTLTLKKATSTRDLRLDAFNSENALYRSKNIFEWRNDLFTISL